jgi:predicted acyl esterase
MKLARAVFFSILLAGAGVLAYAESDKEVEAHKAVLDLAGAFSNDGFKMRDGHWSGTLKPKEPALIAVNLYAGNQYWFSVGALPPAKKIEVTLYDEAGKQVSTESYNEGERAAAGFSPTNSGQYIVAVGLLEGDASSYCLVYSYK